MRRYDDPPLSGKRYRYRPGVYAILPRAGHVLLTRQSKPWPEFQLPGGGIDPGESPVQALHREVLEETGWTISRALRLGAYRRFVYMPEYAILAEKVCHIYVARPGLQIGPPTEEGHTALWKTPPDALATLANLGDKDFLAKWIRHS